MLPKANRLARNSDFRQTFKKGETFLSPFFVAKSLKTVGESKLAVVISKSKVPKAASRNLIKRRLRAAFIAFWPQIKKSANIIVLAKKEAQDADFHALSKAVSKFLIIKKII